MAITNTGNGRWLVAYRVFTLAWIMFSPVMVWMLSSIITLREFRAEALSSGTAVERRMINLESEIKGVRSDLTKLIATVEITFTRLQAEALAKPKG